MQAFLRGNKFHGGYYIFLKGENIPTDKEILQLLDMKNSRLSLLDNLEYAINYKFPKLYLTECSNWKHLMDNFSYSFGRYLAHKKKNEAKDIFSEMIHKFEVFEASVSDVDETFHYRYYKNGEMIRHHSVQSVGNSFSENHVAIDFGEKKLGEKQVLEKKNAQEIIFKIAEIYGIEIHHEIANIRSYIF